MSEIMDSEDATLIARGLIVFGIFAAAFLALAGVAGLAWTIFRLMGGL